jgi:amino acid transporter
MSGPATLKRTLSLAHVILYGLGTTIGAGIYALVGELAGVSGYMAPASFLMASFLAGLTAMSFAELSGRFPRAAGAALYVQKGLGSERLSLAVGILVILAGLVSASALVNGFIGYLHQFVEVERFSSITTVTLLLGMIAAWGIAESVFIAALITVLEVGGLLLIIVVSHAALAEIPARWTDLLPTAGFVDWGSIGAGSLLAFYAFIGFEDMVDVAEEVRDVKRNMPIAILLTLVITTVLYMLIMIAAVLALPPAKLAGSEAPLAILYEVYTEEKPVVISVIGLFAIINGALIQMIMASRVMYGLSSRGQLPAVFSTVNAVTRTPLYSTAAATSVVMILATVGRLAILAETTSLIILTIFSLVNLSLWRIKRCEPEPPGGVVFPAWIPLSGFLISAGFVIKEIARFIKSFSAIL